MDEFRLHHGWCAQGSPADGRVRLDLFPDYGAGDVIPWRRQGEELAARLAGETGAEVVLLWPELDDHDESRPHCATQLWDPPGRSDGGGA